MVTVLPEENPWGGITGGAAKAGLQEYMKRSDESAIRHAIKDLPVESTPRDILNALTNVSTYSNEAKQQAFKNYVGVSEFEQLQRKEKAQRERDEKKLELEESKIENKKLADEALAKFRQDTLALKQGLSISKKEEKSEAAQGALELLQKMRDIGAKNNLGVGVKARGLLSPETRKDAAAYSRYGRALISYASPIVIRNRVEFEILAHDLYDPSNTDAEREGILDAMEDIIKLNVKDFSKPAPQIPEGKIKVRNKKTGQVGSIIPKEGWESEFELVK